MFGLLFFIGFAPSEWSFISLFIAGVLTAGASLLSYGVYWVWGKIRTTKV
jgi:Flp pilus assembly pilin Flp